MFRLLRLTDRGLVPFLPPGQGGCRLKCITRWRPSEKHHLSTCASPEEHEKSVRHMYEAQACMPRTAHKLSACGLAHLALGRAFLGGAKGWSGRVAVGPWASRHSTPLKLASPPVPRFKCSCVPHLSTRSVQSRISIHSRHSAASEIAQSADLSSHDQHRRRPQSPPSPSTPPPPPSSSLPAATAGPRCAIASGLAPPFLTRSLTASSTTLALLAHHCRSGLAPTLASPRPLSFLA